MAAGALDATAPDLATLAERSTIVALALPVEATIDALRTTPALDRPELVFDVASVKVPVVAAARERAHFVASHPMAGRETGGFGAADATLFEQRTWAVAPAGDAVAQARLEAFVTALGARPLVIAADSPRPPGRYQLALAANCFRCYSARNSPRPAMPTRGCTISAARVCSRCCGWPAPTPSFGRASRMPTQARWRRRWKPWPPPCKRRPGPARGRRRCAAGSVRGSPPRGRALWNVPRGRPFSTVCRSGRVRC